MRRESWQLIIFYILKAQTNGDGTDPAYSQVSPETNLLFKARGGRKVSDLLWTEEKGAGWRYRRADGAVVKFDGGPSKLQWLAFEPDPSEAYLIRYSKGGAGYCRRWKTAEAAMQAVDREYPSPAPPREPE